MPGKTKSPRVNFDQEALQSQLREARDLMEQGCFCESLIHYLKALENSLGALQENLSLFREVVGQLRFLSGKQFLPSTQNLQHDLIRLGKNYIKTDPSTLH